MSYDNWKSTEPDNRDDDPGPDGDECQYCHAKAGEPCEVGCLPPGAELDVVETEDLVLAAALADAGGR